MYVCATASFFSLFVCTPSFVFGTFSSWESVIIVFDASVPSFSSFSSVLALLIASLANERCCCFPRRFGGIVFVDAFCVHLGSTSFFRASIGNVAERYTSLCIVVDDTKRSAVAERRAEKAHKRRASDLVVPLRHAMSAARCCFSRALLRTTRGLSRARDFIVAFPEWSKSAFFSKNPKLM